MNPSEIITQAEKRMQSSLEHFNEDLKKLRTGRASSSMLDGIMVQAYGTSMPLNQTANVTAPEAQLIQITPFDPNNIQAIASAIRENSTLGLNPTDDGRVVRVPIPPLTTERRQQIVKQLGEKLEECMIALRRARHEALDAADKSKKDKLLGEDEHKRLSKQVEELNNKYRNMADLSAKSKESEIMTL